MSEETEVVVVLPPNVLDGTEARSGKQQPYDVPFNQAILGNAWSEFDLGEHERYVAEKLYKLSEKLGRMNPDDQAHGCFGGEWGYGQDFKNDIFEMHPYYWGDCDCGAECPKHQADCEQVTKRDNWISRRIHFATGGKPAGEFGLLPPIDHHKFPEFEKENPYPTCTCGAEASWVEKDTHELTCSTVRPNFRYQDIEIRWYKYIGRGMTVSREVTRQELIAMFRKCFASVANK